MKHIRVNNALPYTWPVPAFRVALIEPEIPQNTGNIARMCAATDTELHLVGTLGFDLMDRNLKRAGLDYWESVRMFRHRTFDEFAAQSSHRLFFFSTGAPQLYTDVEYRPGDTLVFGSETSGLPASILEANAGRVLAIPIRWEHVRSLNLATAAGIVLYEALRQISTRPRHS